MDSTETNFASFDDPGLKAAVRGAWGTERAPQSLRARIEAMAAAERARGFEADAAAPAVFGTIGPDTTPPAIVRPPRFWQQPWLRYGFAAAAMVLVGFGLAHRLDDTPFGRDDFAQTGGGGTDVTLASTLPPPIRRGMLESHDRCQKFEHNAYPDLPAGNFPAMRERLEKHLGFPVLAGDVEEALGRNGWRFQGAAVCKVGGVDAAHLVFVRNRQAISLFSLPRSCSHTTRGGGARECEDPNPDHPVALFVWSDGVHCVVGSSTDRSLSVDQVRSVLDHLRPTLADPKR